MLFNSYEFIFLFLPIVLAGYYLLFRRGGRLGFLTVMSYLFYGWWDWRFCSLMLISTLIDYQAGRHIYASEDVRVRRRWLLLSVASNLSLLGFFKYFDLVARSVNQMTAWFGADAAVIPLLHVVLPVGISFYTFQSMSYSLDIYQRAAKPARSIWDFACYVALFPQLIAGPIVRYRDLAEQLVHRTHTWAKASLGISFFIVGLAKKVILADGVAFLVADAFEASAPGLFSAWIGTLAYTMQIYFDFSGYSDMAVGLGLMLGFRLPQNFHSPYKATSITDFWRRWHISLSSWLRDYLYIPLGGNRLGAVRTYVNLFITMLLGGLWHGANWNFVVWGGYHGLLLAIERKFNERRQAKVARRPLGSTAKDSADSGGRRDEGPPADGGSGETASSSLPLPSGERIEVRGYSLMARSLRRLFTFLLVMIGWVFFRADTMGQAMAVFRGMLGLNGVEAVVWALIRGNPLPYLLLVLTLGLAFVCPNTWEIRWRTNPLWFLGLVALFVLAIATIFVNTASPFLYFQF